MIHALFVVNPFRYLELQFHHHLDFSVGQVPATNH